MCPRRHIASSFSFHVRCTRTMYVTRTVYVCQRQRNAFPGLADAEDRDGRGNRPEG